MSLDPNKWTSKVQAAWKSAIDLAADEGHSETQVIHLAVALFEDPDGLARQVFHTFVFEIMFVSSCMSAILHRSQMLATAFHLQRTSARANPESSFLLPCATS
jgi:ATP-dependent Clp protease ATP-binding subunit ClpA